VDPTSRKIVEDPCVAAIAAIGWHEEQAAVAMDGPRAPVQRELIFDSENIYLCLTS